MNLYVKQTFTKFEPQKHNEYHQHQHQQQHNIIAFSNNFHYTNTNTITNNEHDNRQQKFILAGAIVT